MTMNTNPPFYKEKCVSTGPVVFGNDQKKNPYHKENTRRQSDEQPPPIQTRYLPRDLLPWSAAQLDYRWKGCYGFDPCSSSSVLNLRATFDPSPLDNQDRMVETPTFNDLNR